MQISTVGLDLAKGLFRGRMTDHSDHGLMARNFGHQFRKPLGA